MDSGVYIREIEIERGKRGEEKRGGGEGYERTLYRGMHYKGRVIYC